MKILQDETGWFIEHDGLLVKEPTLEEAVISYGEGMRERGKQSNA